MHFGECLLEFGLRPEPTPGFLRPDDLDRILVNEWSVELSILFPLGFFSPSCVRLRWGSLPPVVMGFVEVGVTASVLVGLPEAPPEASRNLLLGLLVFAHPNLQD